VQSCKMSYLLSIPYSLIEHLGVHQIKFLKAYVIHYCAIVILVLILKTAISRCREGNYNCLSLHTRMN
jgi:hypothetical protein